MKRLIFAVASAAILATPAAAYANNHGTHHATKRVAHAKADARTNATVVERDARGRATKVSVDGTEYLVCSRTVVDSCINPRQAGLNFGNVPLSYWPGKPASER